MSFPPKLLRYLLSVDFLTKAILTGLRLLVLVLIGISLIISEVSIFMATWMPIWEKCPFRTLAHFLIF